MLVIYEVIPGPMGEGGCYGRIAVDDLDRFWDNEEDALVEARRVRLALEKRHEEREGFQGRPQEPACVEVWKREAMSVACVAAHDWYSSSLVHSFSRTAKEA